MILLHALLYLLSFIAIWFGSGLIVSSVEKFSKRLRLSSFAVSFFVLGLLTSTPEIAVGLTAVAKHDPEIFVGNLLGGIVVIFLFIIPLLAVFGNGINLYHKLNTKTLLATLAVILAPSLLIINQRVSLAEGIILIVLYMFLFYFIESKHGIFDHEKSNVLQIHAYSLTDLGKIIAGIALVFASSQIIVDKTMYFAEFLKISPFYISLVMLSLGTNLPELSLAVRSLVSGNKDVAFGDYMGSAAANTLLFGIFTILSNGEVLTNTNFFVTFFFIALGLVLFFLFTRKHDRLSRGAGVLLLAIYMIFIIFELIR